MKAFYIECSAPFWQTTAKVLFDQNGIEPVYWTGLPEFEADLKQLFPNLVYHDCKEAQRGQPYLDSKTLPNATFDALALEVWQQEAHTFYEMLSRFDFSGDYTFEDRRRYFYHALLYWYAVLQHYQPELMVFPNAPHMGYDYILWAFAKRLGIKTVFFEMIGIGALSTIQQNFELGDLRMKQAYENLLATHLKDQPVVLNDEIESYVQKVLGQYNQAVPELQRLMDEKQVVREKEKTPLNVLNTYLKMVLKDAKQLLGGYSEAKKKWMHVCRKQQGVSLKHSWRGSWSRLKFEIALTKKRKQTKALKHYYQQLAEPFDAKQKYIYVALSGQPERTSCPQAGAFTNQLLMIQTLSACVPEDWVIYVKDHPSHFDPFFYHFSTGRKPSFYEDCLTIPKVKLLPAEQTPFEVIDGCQAVATLNGTVGMEAVIRGKPALLFGVARYRFCPGTYDVFNAEACKEAINQIQSGQAPVDSHQVRLFLKALEQVSFKGISDPLLPWFELSQEENGHILAEQIQKLHFSTVKVLSCSQH